jgi:hypothetical protein
MDQPGTNRVKNQIFSLARLATFVMGVALSLLAIYSFAATAWIVLRDPGLVLPDTSLWTAGQLQSALAGIGLPGNIYAIYSLAFGLAFSLVFLICGWLILLRKNQDWFGLFLALLLLGWTSGNGVFTSLPQASPAIDTLQSYLSWLMWVGLFSLAYFFPSGHVTPRWARWFLYIWGLVLVYGIASTFLDILTDDFIYFIPLVIAVLLVGGYAQVYRYRHAGALEKQQIKWVVAALLLMVVAFILIIFLENFTGLTDPQKSSLATALLFQVITSTIGNIVFMGIPVSIALAMMRYRLWDVDIFIRRTLVYTLLTTTLALVFFGGVTLLQSLFLAVSGQQSAISIVLSTLAIAALFNPLRKRIQNGIDRRFYRKKYNAEQALARFAATAREETDFEQLSSELQAVVQETMQPEIVTLWLKSQKRIR